MAKKIVYTRPDGGISIIHPTGVIPIEQVLLKDVPKDAINPQIVDESDIPSDRSSRDSWVISGKKVVVDPVKLKASKDAKAAKDAQKSALLSKLKLSDSEFEIILGKGI